MKNQIKFSFNYKTYLFFALTLSLSIISIPVKADPDNCEACYELPESQIEQCLTDNGCNSAEIPIDDNLWVLILGGIALISYQAYRQIKKSRVVN